jgi:hypothetical protein
VAIMEAPVYVGLLSNIGILFWCASATICIFSFAVLQKNLDDREVLLFLLFSGLMTVVLLLDDLFLYHEEVFPEYLHIPQKAVLAGYGIMIFLYLIRFRKTIIQTEFLVLLFSFGFFGLSIIIDWIPQSTIPEHHLFEDGSKLLGILSWFAYFTRVCVKQVRCAIVKTA